jgi:hypothetical protein
MLQSWCTGRLSALLLAGTSTVCRLRRGSDGVGVLETAKPATPPAKVNLRSVSPQPAPHVMQRIGPTVPATPPRSGVGDHTLGLNSGGNLPRSRSPHQRFTYTDSQRRKGKFQRAAIGETVEPVAPRILSARSLRTRMVCDRCGYRGADVSDVRSDWQPIKISDTPDGLRGALRTGTAEASPA